MITVNDIDRARAKRLNLTVVQADEIRQAHYIMDGPSDRPKTVAGCHVMIERLLVLIGTVTGITHAGAISPAEKETGPCSDCGCVIRYLEDPWYVAGDRDAGLRDVCQPCARACGLEDPEAG